jgi:5-methylthioadenosine/S-adenosylhomocysteine deaminase
MITFKNIAIATADNSGKVAIRKNVDVKIKENTITEIGENLKPEGEIIAGDYFLTPGFINAHIHPTGVLSKGLSDNFDWKELAEKHHQSKFNEAADQRTLASVQCFVECLKGGATTCLASSTTLDEIAEANNIIKNRVFAFAMPKDLWNGENKAITFDTEKIKEMFDRWSEYDNELFTFSYGIASLRGASDFLVNLVLDSALNNKKLFNIHIAQSRIDLATTIKVKGAREVEYVYKKFKDKIIKLGGKAFFVHAALVDKKEIKEIKELNPNVVICAGAMAKIGTGFAPLKEYMKSGVNLLLGTDLSLNNDSNNILAEAQFTALAYKAKEEDAGFLSSEDIFKMLTANGEKAGLGKIGRIKEGYLADINVFDLNIYPFVPSPNYLNNLIFNGFNARPEQILINGKFVIKNYDSILDWNNKLMRKYNIKSEKDLYKVVRSFVK